jgi:PAP2 superfamily
MFAQQPIKTRLGRNALSAWCVAITALGSVAQADVVTDWNATATTVLLANPAAHATVHTAMVHVAIYDAVNAIEGRYAVYAARPTAVTQGASKEAAAASAAYHLLSTLFPTQQALLDSAYATSLAAVPDGTAESKGIILGQQVAMAIIALRANDGRTAVVPYTFGSGPGFYQATPPAFGNPIAPYVAHVTPFALLAPWQFRAYGPPDLSSAQYASDYQTVKLLGAANSTKRTEQQTEIGRFHTENPTVFWARNLREVATAHPLDLGRSARLFAMLYVGMADAGIACWDSKYHYNFWRPVTAIGVGDTDTNPATRGDPSWLPLVNTPPHPEYPAAHGCVSGAVAEVLEDVFGNRLHMTFTSTVASTIPHVFDSPDELVKEILVARVYGGMHFPTSVRHGAQMGKQVGKWVVKRYFMLLK